MPWRPGAQREQAPLRAARRLCARGVAADQLGRPGRIVLIVYSQVTLFVSSEEAIGYMRIFDTSPSRVEERAEHSREMLLGGFRSREAGEVRVVSTAQVNAGLAEADSRQAIDILHTVSVSSTGRVFELFERQVDIRVGRMVNELFVREGDPERRLAGRVGEALERRLGREQQRYA
jgi:hypothetical protein